MADGKTHGLDIPMPTRGFDSGRRCPVALKKRTQTETTTDQNRRTTRVELEYGDTEDCLLFVYFFENVYNTLHL